MPKSSVYDTDSFDLAILRQLTLDSRVSWTRLAERVNLSASACQRRVEALVAAGVIERFTVAVNQQAMGQSVKAFVAVNVERQETQLADDFRRDITRHAQVQSCHMISGAIDFMLEVVAQDLAALAQFLDNDLLAMPGVRDATSSIVLNVIKPHESGLS